MVTNQSEFDPMKNDAIKLLFDIIIRLVVTAIMAAFGFYLMFASTFGPTIAPTVWDGNLDGIIRMSMLGGGFLLMLGAIIYLLFPPLRWIWQKTVS